MIAHFDSPTAAMTRILLLCLCCLISWAHAAPKLAVGDAPPSTLGLTLDGEQLTTGDHAGKIVIATFWATWCAPCRQEIAILSGVREAVPKENLEIVAINFGEAREVFTKASKLLASTGLTLTHDRRSRLSRKLGIKSIPYMLLIDHTGKIKHIHTGFGDKSTGTLVQEINVMLAEQDAAKRKS